MPSDPPVIRRVEESELELALDWAAAEGWSPGLDDSRCFYAAGRSGFFLARVEPPRTDD